MTVINDSIRNSIINEYHVVPFLNFKQYSEIPFYQTQF